MESWKLEGYGNEIMEAEGENEKMRHRFFGHANPRLTSDIKG